MFNASHLTEKWAPVLNASEAPAIMDKHRRDVTAVILENQEKALREDRMLTEGPNTIGAIGGNALSGYGLDTKTGGIAGFDPVMISLVRRAMPNLVAYDICGVQPMSGPTGLIFAMKAHYQHTGAQGLRQGREALFNEPDVNFSANTQGPAAYNDPVVPIGVANDPAYAASNPGLLNDAGG